MIEWLATAPVFIVFNRIRGGGMSTLTDYLPSRALFWVAGVLGGLTTAVFGWQLGVAVALGFSVWGAPGWGLWFDLHRNDAANAKDPRQSEWFVKTIQYISFTSDYVALFWRHFWLVLPFLGACAYLASSPLVLGLAVPFAFLVVAGYELGHQVSPTKAITIGELVTGFLWWTMILIVGLL